MALKALNCPNCGGKIETFDESMAKGICPFCDSIIVNVQEEQDRFIKEIEKSEEKECKNIGNYLVLGESAFETNNFNEAEIYANKVIEVDSQSIDGWLLKGRAISEMSVNNSDRVNQAVACFKNALKFSNNEVGGKIKDYLYNLCKPVDEAYSEIYGEIIIKLDSEDPEGWFAKGKSIAWKTTIQDNRFEEYMSCLKNTIKYSDGDYIKAVKESISKMSTQITQLYADRFVKVLGRQEKKDLMNWITKTKEYIIDFGSEAGIDVKDLLADYEVNIAQAINNYVVAASDKTDESFGRVLHSGNAIWPRSS